MYVVPLLHVCVCVRGSGAAPRIFCSEECRGGDLINLNGGRSANNNKTALFMLSFVAGLQNHKLLPIA